MKRANLLAIGLAGLALAVAGSYWRGYDAGDSAARTDYADLVNDCYSRYGEERAEVRPSDYATASDLYGCIAAGDPDSTQGPLATRN